MRRRFWSRRGPLLVTALAVLAAFLTTAPAATAAPASHAARTTHAATATHATVHPHVSGDVYIRDTTTDTGAEPDPAGFSWRSPDIWVCPSSAPCPYLTSPVVGANDFINVHLNLTGTGPVTGDLHVYRTTTGVGGLTNWPTDWVPVSVAYGVSVPTSGTTVILPWSSVPGPGDFCLLARWVSAADPMAFPEVANTETNTVNNNNIAWRNEVTRSLGTGGPVTAGFTIGALDTAVTTSNLVIADAGTPFVGNGRLTIDLGQTLFSRWQQAGEQGTGIQPAGGTTIQIVNPKQATIQGLTLQPKERIQTTLTFAGTAQPGTTVTVDQTDPSGNDEGGVAYVLNPPTQ
jgi:hypothetical protein